MVGLDPVPPAAVLEDDGRRHRPGPRSTPTTGLSRRTSTPAFSTRSRHVSHIIPGPSLGYWNSSMRLVTCLARLRRPPARRARSGSHTALNSDMPLMRWAPQSAETSDGGTPHTFSL